MQYKIWRMQTYIMTKNTTKINDLFATKLHRILLCLRCAVAVEFLYEK